MVPKGFQGSSRIGGVNPLLPGRKKLFEQARRELETAIHVAPDNPWTDVAREHLDRLKDR